MTELGVRPGRRSRLRRWGSRAVVLAGLGAGVWLAGQGAAAADEPPSGGCSARFRLRSWRR